MAIDTLLRKVWVSVAITVLFIAVTIVLVSVPASRFTGGGAKEYAAAIARVIIGLMVIVTLPLCIYGAIVLHKAASNRRED